MGSSPADATSFNQIFSKKNGCITRPRVAAIKKHNVKIMATKVVIISENKEFSKNLTDFLSEICETQQGLREIHTFYQHWLAENDTAPTSEEASAYRSISKFIDFLASADLEIKDGFSQEEQIKINEQIIADLQAKKQQKATAAEGNVK